MTSPRIIRQLLLATACAWGMSSMAAWGTTMDEASLPGLIGELQVMSPDEREQRLRSFRSDIRSASPQERLSKRNRFRAQWAALSPEQREQLRNQIREHRQRRTEEGRETPGNGFHRADG